MRLEDLNGLERDAAMRELLRCCGSPRWAERMTEARPFSSLDAMEATADACWQALGPPDWLEAFAAHPRIGATGAGEVGRSGGAAESWSDQEQSGVADAADATLARLAAANRDYEARFGYIFIVCATGKSAEEMLEMLERRRGNAPETEMRLAAEEQRKITRLRLLKLLDRNQDMNR